MADITTNGEQIGSVISMTGSAWAISGNSQRPLTEGAPVYEGEEIITESDSNVEIRLADDTILGQGEDSAIRLDDYVYTEDAGSLDFSMIKGVLRVVSGEIVKANPEGFNLTTPMATIGIRGTEIMVQIDEGREIIGVDKMGEGHHVVISNAFNEVIIDREGMFSGVDFDGSLIVPDEMPENFISAIVRAAPLTILGDIPRNLGDSQQVTPPQFYETIDNQSGEVAPGEGMEYAETDDEEDEDEDFELSEEEIEALLDLETAGGTEETGVLGQAFGSVVQTTYNEFRNNPDSNDGDSGLPGGGGPGGEEGASGGDNTPPEDVPQSDPPPQAEDISTEQGDAEENAPVSYNVLNGEDSATLVAAELDEASENEGEVEFEPEGTITYTPAEGEDGTVVIDYTIEDSEGETTTAHLSIELADDSEPVITISDATGEVIEGVMVANGTISTDFGADADGSSIELEADDADWDDETGTLTADDESWSIELTDDGYQFTQYAALEDAEDADPGEELDIDVTVVATDSDGDIATGSFSVTVTDDGPTATDAVFAQASEDTSVSYNVISSGDATTGLYAGALIAAELAEGSGEVNFNEDGTITYTPNAGETGTVVIDYEVEDSDGDTASAQLSIELTDDSEPVITVSDATGDEADGLVTVTGTVSADFGVDSAGSGLALSADGATWNDAASSLTADDLSWTIDLTGNEYEFTQIASLDHTEGEVLDINVTVTATDGDGSVSTGLFTVSIDDDGPTATDVYLEPDDPDETISYNVLTEGDAETGIDGGYLMNASLAEGSDYNGEVEFDEDGTISYTPDDGETGTVVIDYEVEDNDGSIATAQFSIELAEPAPEPEPEPEPEPNEDPVNLLVNGDFSDMTAPISGWVAANASSVDGWDAGSFYNSNSEAPHNVQTGGGTKKIEIWQAGFKGVLDPEGNDEGYFVEIDYAGATDFISQTVETEEGTEYSLSFAATIRPDSIPGETLIVQVWSGEELIAEETYTPDVYDTEDQEGWTQFTLEFTADSDETTVMFTEPQFRDEGNAKNTYGVLLDNVSLTAGSEGPDNGEDYQGNEDGYGDYGYGGFVFGTDGDDRIEGSNEDDVIFGGEGDDTIDSGKGMDLVLGNEGDDSIDGGQGMDHLDGGDGDDVIIGGQGDDYIIGGDGDDTLSGGQGSDTFVFTSPYDGTDTILDFKAAQDQIVLHESGFDFNIGELGDDQFTTVNSATYSGGFDFTDATSGMVYASEDGSQTGNLYFDPDDMVDGDEVLLASINEECRDSNLVADDIEIV